MNDHSYMELALSLAKSVSGQTSPNPPVGSVAVKEGRIIGMGAHLRAGEPHAEVHAMNMAGDSAHGSTVYVTLEPCSHYGKTPPCADLLINKGVKRVVVATTDEDSRVSGKGIEKLRSAGIEVDVGILKEEAEQIYKPFFHYIKYKTPYVTIKSAITMDGKTATVTKHSQWVTGEESRRDVHEYRHKHDAILVGVGTVIADNPSLTTRLPNGGKNPVRIVLDTNLRTPLESNVITDGKVDTWIIIGNKVEKKKMNQYLQYKNVDIIQLNQEDIKIPQLLKALGERGIMKLFVEGGAEVNGSFLKSNAFQQLITYIAPKLVGGRDAPTSFGGPGFITMDESLNMSIKSVDRIGEDVRVVAERRNSEDYKGE
ncbi:bifunctional diaminohydroxyphosphoribosylaminopyrimidine deaminase/5-amino-6-(5-phosphoribosylamino)uracil reductase RibD [Salirhabdus salicampi]|uniref:bifunctional diaminohydroxyphosphoribosylaminopyrimidine deaminase/5-amino-6-(5-phosphoribosylamino)uracil reductase RibD n=1 Tax=Salirhabdus salicampi TaxID=476102 RepID=UPI0020C59E4A|nr:bifunctional diaminohydroxyphosphoribosylaminopyrimidine deaminase/5-amino-6-(5-phosphoribosylamino)uracil reductase RibD [Salirhabdus salicampi]MCP8618135.1 bifunctional diaminohydroxyphosphoribosylaminopyrimidine deaminase/5-amino-6-(5-phosphoribosylamino)uracil reductase RibD [Salirhabdus salicampi]